MGLCCLLIRYPLITGDEMIIWEIINAFKSDSADKKPDL